MKPENAYNIPEKYNKKLAGASKKASSAARPGPARPVREQSSYDRCSVCCTELNCSVLNSSPISSYDAPISPARQEKTAAASPAPAQVCPSLQCTAPIVVTGTNFYAFIERMRSDCWN